MKGDITYGQFLILEQINFVPSQWKRLRKITKPRSLVGREIEVLISRRMVTKGWKITPKGKDHLISIYRSLAIKWAGDNRCLTSLSAYSTKEEIESL
jgi:hypothetical protein